MMTNKSIQKIGPILLQLLFLGISAAVFALILLNRSPNFLRPLSMSLRTGFGLVIPLTAVVLYLAFRIPKRAGDLFSMAATLALFALPLAGFWASGQSQSTTLSGLIPLSDAASYYNDSLRILAGQNISHFSAMRPIFPGFLSFLMAVTDHNLMFSLAIITAIAAIAAYYSVREVQRTHGAEVAVFVLLIIFIYYRHHSGTSMSETLGVPLGTLGIGLIWRGMQKRSQPLAVFGLFMSTLALNTRPGTMFILPFMVLWLAWIFRKDGKYISVGFLLWGMGVIVLGFALNSFYIRLLAEPSGTAFSNFSWALYGLASGGNSYTHVFEKHPEVFLLKDPGQSRAIYRLAIDLIIHSPNLFMQGVLHNWAMFFSQSWYSAFSFLESENGIIYMSTRWIIYSLCLLGFLKWLLKPGDPYSGLVALAALGILVSVPFVPPSDAYRVRLYAASIVIFGLLPGMGLSLIITRLKFGLLSRPNLEVQDSHISAAFSMLLVVMVLGGTLLVRGSGQPLPAVDVMCPAGNEKIAIRFDAGSSINIVRENKVFLDWMPDFHHGLFKRNVHSLADTTLINYLKSLAPQTTIFSSLDHLTNRQALIVISTDLLPAPGTDIGLCGTWEKDPGLQRYDVFFADDVVRLVEQ